MRAALQLTQEREPREVRVVNLPLGGPSPVWLFLIKGWQSLAPHSRISRQP